RADPAGGWVAAGSDADRDDVAVLDDVITALDAEDAFVAGGNVAATLDQLGPADRLGFDEGFHDLGVDRAGGLEGGGAAVEGTGDRLLALAGGEEGEQLQE